MERPLILALDQGTTSTRAILFSADGQRGYFALSGSDQVAVVDLPGRKLVQNFETGLDPDGIGIAH